MRFRRSFPFLLSVFASAAALAGDGSGKSTAPPEIIQDPLTKGVTEIEVLGGYFHSPITTGGTRRPEFDYSGVDFRYGVVLSPMLYDKSTVLRGNIEVLLDALGDGIVKGSGTYLTGGSILFRYNFIQPGSRILPYFQLGGGGLHSDAAEDHSQRLVGSDFEFILEADLGLRLLLNDRWSLLLEGGFEHISNADTAARNVGVNALGGRIGLGYIY